jgi:hypothetical protein
VAIVHQHVRPEGELNRLAFALAHEVGVTVGVAHVRSLLYARLQSPVPAVGVLRAAAIVPALQALTFKRGERLDQRASDRDCSALSNPSALAWTSTALKRHPTLLLPSLAHSCENWC